VTLTAKQFQGRFKLQSVRTTIQSNRQPGGVQNRLIQTLEKGGRVRLNIRNMSVPIDKSTVYRIYANPEVANRPPKAYGRCAKIS